MIEDENYIRFQASISTLQSAIQISGMKDGARLKIDVPQSEMEAILKLQQLAGEIFEVIIIPLNKEAINKAVNKKNKIKFLKDSYNESA